MQPDFSHLYSLLKLDPACTLEEFHRAYRRAIAELHPDRWEPASRSPEQQSHLRELISLHALATSFYRRHGRLPGSRDGPAEFERSPAMRQPDAPIIVPNSKDRRWLALAAIAGFIAWQWSAQLASGSEAEPQQIEAGVDQGVGQAEALDVPADSLQENSRPVTIPDKIAIGMHANTVLEIQGHPDHRTPTEWHYGASWLRFEDRRLVDWYSSPLRPLHAKTATPP